MKKPFKKRSVFTLVERAGENTIQLISRGEALRDISRHGTSAYLKTPLTLYYYVPTEDMWYPAQVKRGTRIKLDGPRPQATPPFSSMENILKQMGISNVPNYQFFLGKFRAAKRLGKFPWVEEPYEIYSEHLRKRGYVPLLELLYALQPEDFEVLEHFLTQFQGDYLME